MGSCMSFEAGIDDLIFSLKDDSSNWVETNTSIKFKSELVETVKYQTESIA